MWQNRNILNKIARIIFYFLGFWKKGKLYQNFLPFPETFIPATKGLICLQNITWRFGCFDIFVLKMMPFDFQRRKTNWFKFIFIKIYFVKDFIKKGSFGFTELNVEHDLSTKDAWNVTSSDFLFFAVKPKLISFNFFFKCFIVRLN